MKKEVADKWIEALRSGKYEQGHFALKRDINDNECFCCLGVLCDISGLSEWREDGSRFGYLNSCELLPFLVQEWSGIKCSSPYLDYSTSLIDMNDSGEYSFEDIAKFIENHWEKL
jgi:hypothetical protein